MKPIQEFPQRAHDVMRCLTEMPRKIISLNGEHPASEFLLHDLCRAHCFNLTRAAFLIDNPDFDCLKGIAGYCHKEAVFDANALWQAPSEYAHSLHMLPFNQQVRGLEGVSLCRSEDTLDSRLASIASSLGMEQPCVRRWQLKHENQGILVYQKADLSCDLDDHLVNGLYLFGFCPVH